MGRSPVTVRDAVADDLPFLTDLWSDALRRADTDQQVGDLEQLLSDVGGSPLARLVVADHDGTPAGAVLLRVEHLSPLAPERVVKVYSPHVTPRFRRRGVGCLLMECAVTFAEEHAADQLMIAVASGSRDANRFMARLALGPLATMRLAPTGAVRSRLGAVRPPLPSTGVGATSGPRRAKATRVLVARRTMRRSRAAG